MCQEGYLQSVCVNYKILTLEFGRVFQLVTAFGKYIHGTNKIVFNTKGDIKAFLHFASSNEYQKNYPQITEALSDPIEKSEIIIGLQIAKRIQTKYYLLRLFSWNVWLASLGYIIFGSILLKFTFIFINKKKNSFWLFADQLYRILLVQSFRIKCKAYEFL